MITVESRAYTSILLQLWFNRNGTDVGALGDSIGYRVRRIMHYSGLHSPKMRCGIAADDIIGYIIVCISRFMREHDKRIYAHTANEVSMCLE